MFILLSEIRLDVPLEHLRGPDVPEQSHNAILAHGDRTGALVQKSLQRGSSSIGANEDGANAMAGNLQQFLRHGAVEGRQAELIGG
jgi:hypothetical protein